MMNPKEAPLYKGFFKIFFFFLLAMVGGFLGGELRALKADALTSSVLPPAPPHKGPGSLLWRSPRAAHLRSWPSCQTLRSRSMTRPVAARVKARPQTWLA